MPFASLSGLRPATNLLRRRCPASAKAALLLAAACLYAAPSQARADEKPAEKEEKQDDYAARIYIGNADGSELKPLVSQPGFSTQGSPDWSPDGKLIAFDTWKMRMGESGSAARITVVNADGTNPRILGDGAMPSFSPQGHRIAFSRYSDRGVWVMSTEGPEKELVLIDDQGWGTDWSPDGTRIAYTTYRNGANLVVFNIVEGTRHTVFEEGASPYRQIYWNFVWSGDGKSIAFRGTRPDGKSEVAMVDARGADHGLKTLYEGDSLPALAWSPDSKQILISRRPEQGKRLQLFSIAPAAGKEPRRLPGLDAAYQYQDMAFSPDGKQIAVTANPPAKPK